MDLMGRVDSNIDLSIIVPVYNVEKYLDQCVTSILSQKFQNFELILINDGSVDSSYEICQKYAAQDHRVTLINQENKGQMKATKAGVDVAKGTFIGFVDSDDWISNTYYDDIMNVALHTNCDIVISNGERILKRKTIPFLNRIKPGFYNKEEINSYIFSNMLDNRDLYGNRGIQPSKCLKVFKKYIIEKIYSMVPLEVKLGEDMASSYAAISLAESIAILDTNHRGYNYRLNNQSVSWSYKKNVFRQSMTLCSFLRNLPGTQSNADYQKDVCYEVCFFTINAFFNEYLIDNQKHGQIKIDRLTAIVNDQQFTDAYKQIDLKTIKFPNRFLLQLLASRNIQRIRFVGGLISIFRHQLIYISQNFF